MSSGGGAKAGAAPGDAGASSFIEEKSGALPGGCIVDRDDDDVCDA